MSVPELTVYVDLIPWHRFGFCASNASICAGEATEPVGGPKELPTILQQWHGKERLRKLFGKSVVGPAQNLKVIFQYFPGRTGGFEPLLRFCYSSSGQMEITPYNISLLHSAAHFMDMAVGSVLSLPS
ncbi:hypothetical protein SAY86_018588 [Trapa natans]|uniref:Uncharacterized protein n=1 Tax=Trapa natans TaxID=22666 RepID=A0AAN7R103_TRANT|nr:hypothetical protein SAY86_018588 [Trapa natans]